MDSGADYDDNYFRSCSFDGSDCPSKHCSEHQTPASQNVVPD